jgi:hypothetical protein
VVPPETASAMTTDTFHHLVGEHLDLVCSLNEDLLGAAVHAAGVDLVAELDPEPGRCCVVLRPKASEQV